MARVGEVAEVNPREVAAIPLDADVSFVPLRELDITSATAGPGTTRPFREVQKGYTVFRDGDLLVAKITPSFENGKIGQARLAHNIGVGSTEFHVLRPDRTKVDDRYLLHFLRQGWIRVEGERRMTGSAGQKRVPTSFLSALNLLLPPLAEQRRIAAILDQADALRAKRRQSIALLDDLAQSVFDDMFGDPSILARDSTLIGSVAAIQIGPFGSLLHKSDYVTGGVPLINPIHISDGVVVPDERFSVRIEMADKLARYRLHVGDIVMARRGEMGRCAVVGDSHAGLLCGTGSLILRLDSRRVTAPYLRAAMSHPSVRRLLEDRALGATLPNLNAGIVKSLAIRVPPIADQMRYVESLESIALIRDSIEAAAPRLDELFATLQAQAFSGQL